MEIVGNMNISIKAEIQNENLENYKCPVCNLVKFSAKNLLIQHMSTTHTEYIEYVFEKLTDLVWFVGAELKISQ